MLLLAGNLIFFASFGVGSLISVISIAIIALLTIRNNNRNSRIVTSLGVTSVISILIFWKLQPAGINGLVGIEGLAGDIQIVGLSFYSLQIVSFIIDSYKNVTIQKSPSFLSILSFGSFFPQSLAGPINRYNTLGLQLESSLYFRNDIVVKGIHLIFWGFLYKLLVADKLALVIDPLFLKIDSLNGLTILFSAYLLSIQIYFDFYGYSLIAVGVANLLSIDMVQNFDRPYQTLSFKKFWHKWHISLSEWFRDYVYIPLGGSRKGRLRMFLALLITFLLSGAWHGLSLNFLIWGGVHALLLITEALLIKSRFTSLIQTIPSKFLNLLFFTTISCTWLIFKITDTDILIATFRSLIKLEQWNYVEIMTFLSDPVKLYFLACALTILIIPKEKIQFMDLNENKTQLAIHAVIFIIGLLALVFLGDIGRQQFLYFQF